MSRLSTFWIGSQLFGVDVAVVQEIVRVGSITPVPLAAPGIAGLINLRGEVLTAIDLRVWLGPGPGSRSEADSVHLVVRADDEPISLVVDAIGAVVDVEGLTREQVPATVREALRELIVGVYLLPDQIVLALDVQALLADVERGPSSSRFISG